MEYYFKVSHKEYIYLGGYTKFPLKLRLYNYAIQKKIGSNSLKVIRQLKFPIFCLMFIPWVLADIYYKGFADLVFPKLEDTKEVHKITCNNEKTRKRIDDYIKNKIKK